MKRKHKILIFIAVLVLFLTIYSIIQRKNNNPKIVLLDGPKKGHTFPPAAITLPPFGILINKNRPGWILVDGKHQPDPNGLAVTKKHELQHWKQFQEQGLFKFYFGYLIDSAIYGYDHNPYEVAARKAAHQCKPFEMTNGKCLA